MWLFDWLPYFFVYIFSSFFFNWSSPASLIFLKFVSGSKLFSWLYLEASRSASCLLAPPSFSSRFHFSTQLTQRGPPWPLLPAPTLFPSLAFPSSFFMAHLGGLFHFAVHFSPHLPIFFHFLSSSSFISQRTLYLLLCPTSFQTSHALFFLSPSHFFFSPFLPILFTFSPSSPTLTYSHFPSSLALFQIPPFFLLLHSTLFSFLTPSVLIVPFFFFPSHFPGNTISLHLHSPSSLPFLTLLPQTLSFAHSLIHFSFTRFFHIFILVSSHPLYQYPLSLYIS